jgi:hypothetical protein
METTVKKGVKNPRQEQINEVIDLIIKKAGVSKKELIDTSLRLWATKNLDLLTPTEMKQYKDVIYAAQFK